MFNEFDPLSAKQGLNTEAAIIAMKREIQNILDSQNDAVYKFKRYEDSSLVYTGVNKHEEEEGIGLYDTVLSRRDYEATFVNEPEEMYEIHRKGEERG